MLFRSTRFIPASINQCSSTLVCTSVRILYSEKLDAHEKGSLHSSNYSQVTDSDPKLTTQGVCETRTNRNGIIPTIQEQQMLSFNLLQH